MSKSKMYIDIDKVLQEKNPRLYNILPRFIISYIKKIIHQNDLNNDLHTIAPYKGSEKMRKFLEIHSITTKLQGTENIPKQGRYIFAANHPFGGPDGIILIATISEFFPNIRFLVNDLLMHIPNMEEIFLPLNKHGKNSKEYFSMIDTAYSSDSQIIVFPAGVVSRKVNGKITDLEWQKSCISHAKKYRRDIIPLFIHGKNSNFFYNLANLRKRLKIQANIEMFFLVDELYKHKNEEVTITFGAPIPYTHFTESKKDLEWAQELKDLTYALANK